MNFEHTEKKTLNFPIALSIIFNIANPEEIYSDFFLLSCEIFVAYLQSMNTRTAKTQNNRSQTNCMKLAMNFILVICEPVCECKSLYFCNEFDRGGSD